MRVRMLTNRLASECEMGQLLANTLEAEYICRADAGTLNSYLLFVTLIASKPTF